MKTKTSVTLSAAALKGMAQHRHEFRSRSEFIDAAVLHFIAHMERQQMEQRDVEILNRRAEALNAEAEDVLTYQVPL